MKTGGFCILGTTLLLAGALCGCADTSAASSAAPASDSVFIESPAMVEPVGNTDPENRRYGDTPLTRADDRALAEIIEADEPTAGSAAYSGDPVLTNHAVSEKEEEGNWESSVMLFGRPVILDLNGLVLTDGSISVSTNLLYTVSCLKNFGVIKLWSSGDFGSRQIDRIPVVFTSLDAVTLPSEKRILSEVVFPETYKGMPMSQDDWVFLGWSLDPDCLTTYRTFDYYSEASDIIDHLNDSVNYRVEWDESEWTYKETVFTPCCLYAVYRPKLSVTFSLDGAGSGNYYYGLYQFPVDNPYGWFEITFVPDPAPALATGYVFTGWSEEIGQAIGKYNRGDVFIATEPVTLHSCWMTLSDYDLYLEKLERASAEEPDPVSVEEPDNTSTKEPDSYSKDRKPAVPEEKTESDNSFEEDDEETNKEL